MESSPLSNPSGHHPDLRSLPNEDLSSAIVHSASLGIPAHETSSHTTLPHGTPPSRTGSLTPPVIQPSIQPRPLKSNKPVTLICDPSLLSVPRIEQQQNHPAYSDPNTSSHEPGSIYKMIPESLEPQQVIPHPMHQKDLFPKHMYVPRQPVDPQGVSLPQNQQHPCMQSAPPLPPKWKSAKDHKGRVYYYHVKTLVSQWLPPPFYPVETIIESESSSDTSDDDDDDDDDESSSTEEEEEGEQDQKVVNEGEEGAEEGGEDKDNEDEYQLRDTVRKGESETSLYQETKVTVLEDRQNKAIVEEMRRKERRREGLVQERIISPRREEDRTPNRKYREIKEKLRRKKEALRAREHAGNMKKRHRDGKQRISSKASEKPAIVAADTSSDKAQEIKDQFLNQMADVIVVYLEQYRKPECKIGRILNTEDFKHLARKLTHFVMLKELKHCGSYEDLECNTNVKHKACNFIQKYMAKFGKVYQRPKDDD